MMHPAEQINNSILQIVNGEYDEAIISLTATLKTVQLAMSGDAKVSIPVGLNDDECPKESDHCKPSSSSSSACYEYEFFSSAGTPSFLKTSDLISVQNFFCSACDDIMGEAHSPMQMQFKLFREPIKVLVCKPLVVNVCKELAYVTIYNLALSHHLKSFETGLLTRPDSRRAYLKKALVLYGHSQLILREREVNIGNGTIHSMAIISSLLHIHYKLGDSQNTGACAQCLISNMIYAIYSAEGDITSNSMEGFLDMILPLISNIVTAEAA